MTRGKLRKGCSLEVILEEGSDDRHVVAHPHHIRSPQPRNKSSRSRLKRTRSLGGSVSRYRINHRDVVIRHLLEATPHLSGSADDSGKVSYWLDCPHGAVMTLDDPPRVLGCTVKTGHANVETTHGNADAETLHTPLQNGQCCSPVNGHSSADESLQTDTHESDLTTDDEPVSVDENDVTEAHPACITNGHAEEKIVRCLEIKQEDEDDNVSNDVEISEIDSQIDKIEFKHGDCEDEGDERKEQEDAMRKEADNFIRKMKSIFEERSRQIAASNPTNRSTGNGVTNGNSQKPAVSYLDDYRLRELLVNNNVIIIEPVQETPPPPKVGETQESTDKGGVNSVITVPEDEENGNVTRKSATLPSQMRQYFYHPVRNNKELVDEELPEPDTVKNVCSLFENILNFSPNRTVASHAACACRVTLVKSNPSSKILRSEGTKSPWLATNELSSSSSGVSTISGETNRTRNRYSAPPRISSDNEYHNGGSKNGVDSSFLCMLKNNTSSGNWWMNFFHDSGSLSSGVSDLSSDTDPENHSTSKGVFSDEEEESLRSSSSPQEVGHHIPQDVLERIRACGSTVTYYGGKIIACSMGPASPTELIMEEIRRSPDYRVPPRVLSVVPKKFRLVKSNSCGSRFELASASCSPTPSDNDGWHREDKAPCQMESLGGSVSAPTSPARSPLPTKTCSVNGVDGIQGITATWPGKTSMVFDFRGCHDVRPHLRISDYNKLVNDEDGESGIWF